MKASGFIRGCMALVLCLCSSTARADGDASLAAALEPIRIRYHLPALAAT